MGDGIMALFPKEALDGLKAAIAIRKELKIYNIGRKRAGYAPVKIGLGLHTGEMILGTVGERHRMETTVISDAVNTASRLESETKILGCSLLISKKVLDKIPLSESYLIRFVGMRQFKGKANEIALYEVFSGDAKKIEEKKKMTKPIFEAGVGCYYRGELGKAKKAFRACLKVNPNDKVAKHYLEEIKESSLNKKFKDIAKIPLRFFVS